MDAIYSALRRPIVSHPDKKDYYHVDQINKDGRPNNVNDEDEKEGKSQKQIIESYTDLDDEKQKESLQVLNQPEGKGKYLDDDGVERLDIFA